MLIHLFSVVKLRIFLAIILATIAFTQWGFIWYATLFDDLWQTLIDRTEEELLVMAVSRGFIQTILTYLISLVQAVGLFLLIHMTRAKTFLDYQIIAAIVSSMIALPVLGNAVLFEGATGALWVLDFSHFIWGYAGMAGVFFIVKNFKKSS